MERQTKNLCVMHLPLLLLLAFNQKFVFGHWCDMYTGSCLFERMEINAPTEQRFRTHFSKNHCNHNIKSTQQKKSMQFGAQCIWVGKCFRESIEHQTNSILILIDLQSFRKQQIHITSHKTKSPHFKLVSPPVLGTY